MKRLGYLYDTISSISNLELAERKARKGKTKQGGVRNFILNKEDNIINLHHILVNKEYRTSEYRVFKIFEKKEREIFQLPYYPDRILHHAVMNVLEDTFTKTFTVNTYSCIKKRGVHKCLADLKLSLRSKVDTKYCLKLDIRKFYPSIDNNILKYLLRRKFKDIDLLALLDEIIDSNPKGQPIGNYLSQYFANFYLTYFDHWLKEELSVKHYFRYCDDLVILGSNKQELHILFSKIEGYLKDNLNLELSNHQIFPVESRGIDFVGYKTYHDYVLLRKSIKKDFIKMIKKNNNIKSIASYKGWLDHANCINLKTKYLNEYNDPNKKIRI